VKCARSASLRRDQKVRVLEEEDEEFTTEEEQEEAVFDTAEMWGVSEDVEIRNSRFIRRILP
jgi:hypothetical protein